MHITKVANSQCTNCQTWEFERGGGEYTLYVMAGHMHEDPSLSGVIPRPLPSFSLLANLYCKQPKVGEGPGNEA